MQLTLYRPVLTMLALAAPAAAVAATMPGIAQPAGVAAVVLWLAGLGWGFHTMLHHRLAAEDQLAALESRMALERDERAAHLHSTRQRMLTLDAEWCRLEECLCNGDLGQVSACMRACQAAIAQLHGVA